MSSKKNEVFLLKNKGWEYFIKWNEKGFFIERRKKRKKEFFSPRKEKRAWVFFVEDTSPFYFSSPFRAFSSLEHFFVRENKLSLSKKVKANYLLYIKEILDRL